ncbi:MAG: transposase [Nitrospirae bacterium]|nr:transposase [Nitrospirota bacterium]
MPNYRRVKEGRTFFFTVVTHERRPLLCTDESRLALREAIKEVRERFPFDIDAWVLMPDHLHCIWTLPEDDTDYSKRWGMIKLRYTKKVKPSLVGVAHPTSKSSSRLKHREGAVWQRRFWEHMIRDDADYEAHMDYRVSLKISGSSHEFTCLRRSEVIK